MNIDSYSFGSITIDGETYYSDVVIDRGEIRKRQKNQSKKYIEEFGHTPVSLDEELPWSCRRLIIGIGAMGDLPVMDEVVREAKRRKVKLMLLRTGEAVKALTKSPARTNAVLHLTC